MAAAAVWAHVQRAVYFKMLDGAVFVGNHVDVGNAIASACVGHGERRPWLECFQNGGAPPRVRCFGMQAPLA